MLVQLSDKLALEATMIVDMHINESKRLTISLSNGASWTLAGDMDTGSFKILVERIISARKELLQYGK